MGLQRNDGTGKGALFFRINAKEGCIAHNQLDDAGKPVKDPQTGKNVVIKEPAMTKLSGTLIGMSFEEDSFEGAKTYKVRLALQDTEPNQPKMFVDFPFGSEANGAGFFGLSLLGKLNAAELGQPVTLMPWIMPEGHEMPDGSKLATARTGVTVYQKGQKLTEDFGDGLTRLPEREKVKVGNKEVTDNSAWDELGQKLVSSLMTKLTPGVGESQAPVDESLDAGEVAGAVAHERPRAAA